MKGNRAPGGAARNRCVRTLWGVLFALALTACTQFEVRTTLPVEVRSSPNFDARRPNYVIIHYTTNQTADRALRTLTNPLAKVSAHYLVGRDGRIYALVDELARAWHAGESYWGGERDINSASIGIELDNDGDEPFAEAQIEALLALLADIKQRYAIPFANFLGHSDVSPRRKVDPGRRFPWKRLADRGFGLWCDAPAPSAGTVADGEALLAALGYYMADPAAALGAFRSHFTPEDSSPVMSAADVALLRCLVAQKSETLPD